MDFLIVLIVIGLFFYILVMLSRLDERINQIEFRLGKTDHELATKSETSEVSRVEGFSPQNQTVYPQADYRMPPSNEPASSSVIEWLKKDLLVKIGALFLILALGWFVSYAIMYELIGPAGQITLGLMASIAFLIVGVWRMQVDQHQGGIFLVLGEAGVLLTIFAARESYNFFTPTVALMIMFMAVVLVAFVSVQYRNQKLAIAGLVSGSIAPLLTASPVPDAVGLFTYLLVVAGGTLWVVWYTGWTRLIFISLLVTYFYSLNFMLDGPLANREIVILFSFIFIGMYFVANMVSLVRRRENVATHLATHVLTAIGTAIFLVTWIESVVVPELQSLLYVAWAIIFALGTYVVYAYTANQTAFYIYGAVSAGLIGIATASELDGPALVLAYLFEIGLVMFAGGKLGVGTKTLGRMSTLLAIPVLLSFESFFSPLWREGIMHADFAVLSICMLVLLMVGLILQALSNDENIAETKTISYSHVSVGIFYATALVWLISHALFENDLATMLTMVIYTLAGIAVFVTGSRHELPYVKAVGAILLGFVIIRLLMVDVWQMELEGRILTFLVVGVLLISTAFIRKMKLSDK